MTDTQAPTIETAAQGQTVTCNGEGNTTDLQEWLAKNGGATATDNCGTVTWTNDFTDFSFSCGQTGSISVTFTAADDCGNKSTTTATFTIKDTTPPTITTNAKNLAVTCDGKGNQAAFEDWLNRGGGAAVSDNCGSVTWSYRLGSESKDCGTTSSKAVTFIAKDACGNESETTATFTINDATAPTITKSANDLTVVCKDQSSVNEIRAWLSAQGGASATDACGEVVWSNDYKGSVDECGAEGTTQIIFTATDACGNSSTTTASLTIEKPTQSGCNPTKAACNNIRFSQEGNKIRIENLDNYDCYYYEVLIYQYTGSLNKIDLFECKENESCFHTVSESGWYAPFVKVYANDGSMLCSNYQWIYIDCNASVNISGDQTICEGENTTLTAIYTGNSSCSTVQYQWSNGQTESTINVNQPGDYLVTVTDCNGCTATNKIEVKTGSNCSNADCNTSKAACQDIKSWADGNKVRVKNEGSYDCYYYKVHMYNRSIHQIGSFECKDNSNCHFEVSTNGWYAPLITIYDYDGNIICQTYKWVYISNALRGDAAESRAVPTMGASESSLEETEGQVLADLPCSNADNLCQPVSVDINGAEVYLKNTQPGSCITYQMEAYNSRKEIVAAKDCLTSDCEMSLPKKGRHWIYITALDEQQQQVCQTIQRVYIHSTPDSYSQLDQQLANDVEPSLKVYPNPATYQIQVRLESFNGIEQQLTLFNTFGEIIYEKIVDPTTGSVHRIDVRHLKGGMYVLKVSGDGIATLSNRVLVVR